MDGDDFFQVKFLALPPAASKHEEVIMSCDVKIACWTTRLPANDYLETMTTELLNPQLKLPC